MKAMILAAGRGERMRPLTDACPKPLLSVGGKPLIVWHLERLARAGFQEVVINHAHLGALLQDALGDGHAFGLSILWSGESPAALETAGGIAKALPLLGSKPFLVINGDIFCAWDVAQAEAIAARMTAINDLAYLVMVANPPQHSEGDFVLEKGRIITGDSPRLTFSGIGIYDPRLFEGLPPGKSAKLAPLLRTALAQGQCGGEAYAGSWHDIGTPERLAALNHVFRVNAADV